MIELAISRFVLAFEATLLVYFVTLNTLYLLFAVVSFFELRRHRRRWTARDLDIIVRSPATPTISLIVPAYNEEATVRTADHPVAGSCPECRANRRRWPPPRFSTQLSSRSPSGASDTSGCAADASGGNGQSTTVAARTAGDAAIPTPRHIAIIDCFMRER